MSTFQHYLRDVHATAMLPAEEQQSLACRFARGRDPRDAQRLVLANLRLVISIVKGLADASRHDLTDLVQEGNAGLMVAIDKFDPTRGASLATYASFWIRAFVLRHLMDNRSAVRASTREGRRRFFARTLPSDARLDGPARRADHGNDRGTLLDLLPDDRDRPDVVVEAREELTRLRDAVARLEPTLDARQRAILRHRLLSDAPTPLRQFGPSLALSGERVRQIEQGMKLRLLALLTDGAANDERAAA
jgi:RNA polymerase sigma-32 factor